MPPQVAYTRLPSTIPTTGSDSTIEALDYDDTILEDAPQTYPKGSSGRVSETFAWRFFLYSCAAAIALSAVNLSLLSTRGSLSDAYHSRKSSSSSADEPKRPSVYLGLENVVFTPSYCRSRGTFPKTFYTYDARHGPHAALQHVHAPDDRMTLTFGGPIRAVVDTYIPDHGLENCTLNLRRVRASDPLPHNDSTDGAQAHQSRAFDIDVYLLPGLDAPSRTRASHLSTLSFAEGTESVSRPFHCPSRSHVFLEWRCAADDCENAIVVPLEGVTSLTASAESLGKTGFRVTQYEAVECIQT
ncbi:hypothetical protein C8Q76DRAFT_777541 [Earliella scabrosa]|nr:hypothetical protein C8Q76DRAFT_777541 [Earliella scabrosa]